MSNNRTTIYLLLAAFLLLLGVGLVQTIRDLPAAAQPQSSSTADPLRPLRESPNRIFTTFEYSAIQAFSLLDPHANVTFSVVNVAPQQWESPEFGYGVTSDVAEQMAFTLSVLPALEVLGDIPADSYADFGLTQQSAYLLVSIVLKDGATHGIVIGDVTPDGLGHYAIVDEREPLYVIDARPIAFLVKIFRQAYGDTDTPEATATPNN